MLKNPITYPLRFGLPYLLLLSTVLRERFPRLRGALRAGEAALMGLGVAVEHRDVCLYGGGLCRHRGAGDTVRGKPGARGKLLLQRFGAALLAMLAAHVIFSLATKMACGSWPDWHRYFDYLSNYNRVGLPYPIAPWGPYLLVITIYFASLLATLLLLATRRWTLRSPISRCCWPSRSTGWPPSAIFSVVRCIPTSM